MTPLTAPPRRADAIVVGAGHNGLVAAIVLAEAGLHVRMFERADVVGGACRTEYPFGGAPQLGASTGAYLLGPFPPELLQALELDLPLLRRDPHYFLPTTEAGRYLLLGSDADAAARSLAAFTSERDVRALAAMQEELAALRHDLAPAWLAPPRTAEATAERYIRPALQEVFLHLVRGSIADHLARFDFAGPLLPTMYAVTDAFPGLHGSWDTPGSGHNFLVHNQCRLPGADGTWMAVQGGMGTVTAALAARAERAGVQIVLGSEVAAVTTAGERTTGVVVDDVEHPADLVLVNADPVRLRGLVGDAALGVAGVSVAEEVRARPGTTLKLNLALEALPRFTSLPQERGQHRGTIHLLPDLDDPVGAVRRAWEEAAAGRVPDRPPIELYLHTALDPSLRDEQGRHSGALFVQWVPNDPAGGWDGLADRTADALLALVDEVAPGTTDRVVDRQILHPAAIEARFGITGGNIFHLDNTRAFTDRLPYATATEGLYACGAACHPAGSVVGAAGWNAAHLALTDRGVPAPAFVGARPGGGP